MYKEDARYQTLAQLHERRKQIVRLHNKGIKVMAIIGLTGLAYSTVRRTLDWSQQGGRRSINPTNRGREKGQVRVLGAKQEQQIQRDIIDKRLEQLKMDICLWSRTAVMQLIDQEYGIKLPVRTVGKYLDHWGFTPQKPIKKAYKQSPEAVHAWLNEQYPAIAAKAKAKGGEIHWGDETALTITDILGRSYVTTGQIYRGLCAWRQTRKTFHDGYRHQSRKNPLDDH